jgi:hypothetical protein
MVTVKYVMAIFKIVLKHYKNQASNNRDHPLDFDPVHTKRI